MDLSYFQTFIEVARLGSISRATEHLVVSQPTLTRRLEALENDLGVQLFVRTRTGVRLTEAGRAFLPHAEHVVTAAADGAREMAGLRRRATGPFVIGTTPGFAATGLAPVLRGLRAAFPSIRLIVKTRVADAIVDLVLRGEVAIGIAQHIEHPDLRTIDLYETSLVLATAPAHPLARKSHARLADLATESVIFETGTGGDESRSHLRAARVKPREMLLIDTVAGAKRMVEEGLGVAVLPFASLATEVRAGSLTTVPIVDPLPPQRVAALLRADEGRLSAPVSTIIALAREAGVTLGGHASREGMGPARQRAVSRTTRSRSLTR